MVDFANEVRRLFMGENGYGSNSIEITFSTRTLLRWADLTVRYQPLASQGIQPIAYALDRALGFRASRETRATLHELTQRIFSLESVNTQPETEYVQKKSSASQNNSSTAKLVTQGLAPLISEAATNPDRLSFEPEIMLECPTQSGRKYWYGKAYAWGLSLRWGKAGTSGGNKDIPKSQCSQDNPVLELQNRCLGKLAKGYDIVPNETTLP